MMRWYSKGRRPEYRRNFLGECDIKVQMSLSISSAEMFSSLYLIPSLTTPCPQTPATDHSGSDADTCVLTPPEAYTNNFQPSLSAVDVSAFLTLKPMDGNARKRPAPT